MPVARRRRRTGGSARGGPDGPTPGSAADATPDADPESVARGIVLRKLTAAPRSRAQLESDLAGRDVPAEVAERVLDRFTEVGLVDDAAFAEAWVRSRHGSRGLSRRALSHELRQKGVDDETARAALDTIGADDEAAAAAALVAKRLPATRGLDRAVRLRRLAGMLARKGYPSGLAMQVVRDALEADDVDHSDDADHADHADHADCADR
ncbi:MAG TPA: regulatory protein RecX [Actinomycetes bacterium]|nr:regulatory protein RecX [Actinomycetes bacterium]